MALTKADIVESIMEQIGFTRNQSSDVTEALIDVIKRTLASGENVLVSGFGKFCVNEKAPRRGRNPATGEAMMLKPRRVVTFKCSGKLRKRINTNE
ncbi:MAG: integration host factor subunit alpha [Desulfobacterales bacterium]